MMETTDFGDRDDWAGGCSGDWPVIQCVLLQVEVCSAPMIVPAVDVEDASQMRLVNDDHVIETLSSDFSRRDMACSETTTPSVRSLPWILGAPQSGFAVAIPR